MSKIEESITLIREAMESDPNAAVLLSFGKDSMVLAHLIRESVNHDYLNFPAASQFPLPVILYRNPWFPHKYLFANKVIHEWDMVVHDFLPNKAGIKVKPDMIELAVRYPFGFGYMEIPINVERPIERRNYVCGLYDWCGRSTTYGTSFKWQTVFHGHKSTDIDQFEGHVPLKSYSTRVGGIDVVFPLRDWTDDDIWDYIEDNHIPYQKDRYENRQELADKWSNPDYLHACVKCIDPRTNGDVQCPKLGRKVPTVRVPQFTFKPLYIDSEVEHA